MPPPFLQIPESSLLFGCINAVERLTFRIGAILILSDKLSCSHIVDSFVNHLNEHASRDLQSLLNFILKEFLVNRNLLLLWTDVILIYRR